MGCRAVVSAAWSENSTFSGCVCEFATCGREGLLEPPRIFVEEED
jgi:hypothetical protein